MKIIKADRLLRNICNETGLYVFRLADLSVLFGESRQNKKLNATLIRLVDAGVLSRPTKSVYVYVECVDHRVLEFVASAARPHSVNVISYESAASRLGLINQTYPRLLTVATTGRSGVVETDWGKIRFTHTSLSSDELRDLSVQGDVLPMTLEEGTMMLLNRSHLSSRLYIKEANNAKLR